MMKHIFDESKNRVYLITSMDHREICGMVATWISIASLASEELRLVAVFSTENETSQTIIVNKLFNIHLLEKGQSALVPLFGLHHSSDIDKFSKISYERTREGIPVIKGTCGYAECELLDYLDTGDRYIAYSKVLRHHIEPNTTPLILEEAIEQLGDQQKRLLRKKEKEDAIRDHEISRYSHMTHRVF